MQTSLVMLAVATSLLAGNIFVDKLMARSSTPAMVLGGLLIGTAGLLVAPVVLTGYVHLWVVSAAMVACGGGIALTTVPTTSTILFVTPGELTDMMSDLLNATRRTGSLLGVAAAGVVVTVVSGLAHAVPMASGPMTLLYAGAMAMAWISRRLTAATLAA